MFHRIQNGCFCASTLCFALLILSGCHSKKTPYGTSSTKPPAALTQTITLRPHGSVMFPDGETTQKKPWAATVYVNTFGDEFSITQNGYSYSASSVWALDNQAKYTVDAGHYKRFLPTFTGVVNGIEVQAPLKETLSDKTQVMEYVDLAGGVTPVSVRVVITPDFHTYVTRFEYGPTAVPTEEQIQHEIEFHHSLKIDGKTIEDSLGEEIGKRYAERTKKQNEIVSQLAKTPAEAEKQIKDSFAAYKAALLSGNGKEAAEYVNRKTLMHYSMMEMAVMQDGRSTLEKRSLLDKIFVLTMRHQVPYMELYELSQQRDRGRAYFIYAVDHGLIGKDSVEKLELVSVEADSETRRKAKTTISSNGRKAPFGFDFTWEDGKWKIDLTSVFSVTERELERLYMQAALGESQFIFALLEQGSGKKPDDSIWNPPQPTEQEGKIIQERQRRQAEQQAEEQRERDRLDPEGAARRREEAMNDPQQRALRERLAATTGNIPRGPMGQRGGLADRSQQSGPNGPSEETPVENDMPDYSHLSAKELAELEQRHPGIVSEWRNREGSLQTGTENVRNNSASREPVAPQNGEQPSRRDTLRRSPPNFQTSLGMSMQGTPFSETTPENGILVGFQVTLKKWGNNDCVESVQPLYRSLKTGGGKRGQVHGNATGEVKRIFAPEGYAVGGLNGRVVAVIDGFELIYMKIKPDGTLDPNDTQTSDWVGNEQVGARKSVDGKGKPVQEVKGYTDDYASSLELVF